jgi:hypothetical protein
MRALSYFVIEALVVRFCFLRPSAVIPPAEERRAMQASQGGAGDVPCTFACLYVRVRARVPFQFGAAWLSTSLMLVRGVVQ